MERVGFLENKNTEAGFQAQWELYQQRLREEEEWRIQEEERKRREEIERIQEEERRK